MRIVECVPNFSEGRDRAVIDRIAAAIAGVDGVSLLDVDPDEGDHRAVGRRARMNDVAAAIDRFHANRRHAGIYTED